jgi:predicted TPR repeat methyltransferase
MAEEQKKNLSDQEMTKKAQQATLRMAKEWQKSGGTTHHAIKSYEDVVRTDPESQEADEARSALVKIAEDWEKKGQKYAAAKLYKKLMVGR